MQSIIFPQIQQNGAGTITTPNLIPHPIYPPTLPPRVGFKELRKLKKQGFRVYPDRPLSYSSLKAFNQSPLAYIEYVTKTPEPSAAMILGKVFECLLFGNDPEEEFVIWSRPIPDKDFRTKVNREAKEEAQAQANALGKDAIESNEFWKAHSRAQKALEHPFMKRVKRYKFRHPKQRVFRERTSGLKLTGIPDLDIKRGKIGIDIKFGHSVAEYEQRLFSKSYALWMQAAMYSLIYGYEEFYFFVTRSQGKPFSQAFHFGPEELEALREYLVHHVLLKFRKHLSIGFFAAAEEVKLPRWLENG